MPSRLDGTRTSELDGNGNSPAGLIGGLTFAAVNPGDFNSYYQGPVNANRETASGLDFQIDYHHDLFAGTMTWHVSGQLYRREDPDLAGHDGG